MGPELGPPPALEPALELALLGCNSTMKFQWSLGLRPVRNRPWNRPFDRPVAGPGVGPSWALVYSVFRLPISAAIAEKNLSAA